MRGFVEAYAIDSGYRTAHHGAELLSPAVSGMEARPITIQGETGSSAPVFEENGPEVTASSCTTTGLPAFGYRFEYRGPLDLRLGRYRAAPALIAAAKDVDVLVHEAQANHL